MSINSQGYSLTLVKGHSVFKVKPCFSEKQLGDLEPKFIWKLEGEWEWKFIQMSWVTWPTWPPCPYMVKTLKNLLQNQQTNDLETWYVASCVGVLPKLFKLWPWVDLDPFYAKVKFGHIDFYMRKSENYLFLGNYCSFRSQSCLKHSAKWVKESGVSIKGQGHSLTLVIGHSDFKVKTCFSQKQLSDLEPEFMWKLKGKWEWKFIQMSWVT